MHKTEREWGWTPEGGGFHNPQENSKSDNAGRSAVKDGGIWFSKYGSSYFTGK
jgi:hypothetical protein